MTTLDELRRANLQEQRRKAEAAAAERQAAAPMAERPAVAAIPEQQTAATTPERSSVAPAAERQAKSPSSKPQASSAPAAPPNAAPPAPAQHVETASEPATDPLDALRVALGAPSGHVNGNGHGAGSIEPPAAEPEPSELPTAQSDPPIDEADRKARAIMDRFYRGLAHKVVYPTGVKATVDMPPDLFWRVKRYCHDHNNVTVRQLFLDLVKAVLEEEGY